MRAGKPFMAVAVALTVCLVLGGATAETSTTARYHGGLPPGGYFLPLSGPSYTLPDHPNVGGAWMSVPAGSRLMDVTVTDDRSEAVAADVSFLIDSYSPLVPGPLFCGEARDVSVPAGSIALYVRVLYAESLACDPSGVPTSGTITAVFS
jgi:hypothetical protein